MDALVLFRCGCGFRRGHVLPMADAMGLIGGASPIAAVGLGLTAVECFALDCGVCPQCQAEVDFAIVDFDYSDHFENRIADSGGLVLD